MDPSEIFGSIVRTVRALRILQSSIPIVNSNRYLQVEKETKKWFSVYDLLYEKVEES